MFRYSPYSACRLNDNVIKREIAYALERKGLPVGHVGQFRLSTLSDCDRSLSMPAFEEKFIRPFVRQVAITYVPDWQLIDQ